MIQKSNSIVTVNLEKLRNNITCLRQYVAESTRIMAVVKADAYGHGAGKLAEVLEPVVDAFAVNDIHEAIELRELGIKLPVLVFGVPEPSIADLYKIHSLTATVSSEEHFGWLPKGVDYHLNFDTGMGRVGFQPEKAGEVAQAVQKHRELNCTGLYSHFATSDNPDSPLVYEQLERFKTLGAHFPNLDKHIANTGGTVFYETEQFSMVRLGIGMYGYAPGETPIEGIEPILDWKTRLVQVKEIKAGTSVSYGARWEAPANGYLGVIPVGYDDGLKRNLTDNLSVTINSKSYELVGTVTMNYSMIFLGEDAYQVGTEVNLLHPGNDAGEWARKTGTIPYEILTSINPKIPRKHM